MKTLTIDGNNLVHRVYWVANNMPTKSEYLHVYMFLNSIKNYVEMYRPDEVICVWDEKKGDTANKRKDILEDYKGNRNKEYNAQVHEKNDIIIAILQTLGIPSIFPRDYEADDVIGIINHSRKKFSPEEYRHIIVTVDRDLCQLITNETVVYEPIKKIEINLKNFEEILKYNPADFIKVKALLGDNSDNIPGIKGFGKIKIQKFIDGELQLNEAQQKIYERNLKLVTLTLDSAEYDYVENQLENANFKSDWTKFTCYCDEYKFRKILNNYHIWYSAFFEKNRLLELLS